MNSALLFALALAFAFAVVGTLVAGRGSVRRGLRWFGMRLKEALTELLLYVVLGGAALLIAFLAGGDAWTFVAIAVAGVCLIVLVILVVRRRNHA